MDYLRVERFRNIGGARVELQRRVTVLRGENGQGKTNFIEAVFFLSNLRAFRTRRLQELIAEGESRAEIAGGVTRAGSTSALRVVLVPRGRQVAVDGKTPRSASDYLCEFPTVLFSAQDLELAQGDQERRRAYLDRAAFTQEPAHLDALRRYGRLLDQRNACLRRGGSDLGVWDEKLAEAGARVYAGRRRALEAVEPRARAVHDELTAGREQIELRLESRYAGEGKEAAEGLLAALRHGRDADRRAGFTGSGPHRDAVVLALGGRDVRYHGSRGQQRTAALALKLSLLTWSAELLGEEPLFLVDDPGSELDAARLSFLADRLARWRGQVVVSGTPDSTSWIPRDEEVQIYEVAGGTFRAAAH